MMVSVMLRHTLLQVQLGDNNTLSKHTLAGHILMDKTSMSNLSEGMSL